MEQRPSDRELDEQMKKTVNELKFRGVYDDLRKQLLGKVEDDTDYKDLLQRVKEFSNRFFHKTRYVEGEKGIIRQRLKTGINDSNNISRYTTNLARDMIFEIDDFKMKDYIRSEMEKYFGLDHPDDTSTAKHSSPPKGRFENTFVQEESSNTSSSFVANRNLLESADHHSDHSSLAHEENSNFSSNKNEDSRDPFPPQVSFSLNSNINKPTMLEMDKISDNDDYDIDDSSFPSPPKIECFSPHKADLHDEESMEIDDNSNDDKLEIVHSSTIEGATSISVSGSDVQQDNIKIISETDICSNSASVSSRLEMSLNSTKVEQLSDNSSSNNDFKAQTALNDALIKVEDDETFDIPKNDLNLDDGSQISTDKDVPESRVQENNQQHIKRKRDESTSNQDSVDGSETIKKIKLEADNKEDKKEVVSTPKKDVKPSENTPQKSRSSRDSKSHAEALLDTFIIQDSKNNYDDCEISEISSVHSSDLSDYEENIIFSDSDFEDLNGLSVETLKLAFNDPEKFVELIEKRDQALSKDKEEEKSVSSNEKEKDEDEDDEEVEKVDEDSEDVVEGEEEAPKILPRTSRSRSTLINDNNSNKKNAVTKPKGKSKKKSPVKRQNSDDSIGVRRSRRRNISSSTDSSIPSKVRVDTPDSSISQSYSTEPSSLSSKSASNTSNIRKLKRNRTESYCSTDESIAPSTEPAKKVPNPSETGSANKRSKVARKQQQSYDASDLYKPRTSNRSNRRSNRSLLDNEPNSPLSTASNSTT